ncbi:hypothetical protein L209DRAFT_743828 [Thermothelomyces heterothallicus CBS 203.75]
MAPTPTRPQVISHLLARQEQQQPTATVVVDSGSSDGGSGSSSGSSLNGGAIAGIVIGSTVGILLLWWIIRACAQPRSPDSSRQGCGSRRHSRRRSSNPRPVVFEEKYAPRRPSATYVYLPVEGRRSRSRSQRRYYG